MKPLISGATFHDFEASPEFVGEYLGTQMIREKDSLTDEKQKAGDIMGFNFIDHNGEPALIGNSHQIAKAIGMIKPGARLYIRFIEKVTNAAGKPVNRFAVDELEEGENPLEEKPTTQA